MKAVCTSEARLNGLQFNPDKEYYFEEQVFTEEYKPAIHSQPARGRQIRYIRYKATLPMNVELDDPHGMTEVRTVYFYDRSYCLHHDWKDERGQDVECFDDHFSICEARRNDTVPTLKKPLWSGLPKKINEDVMEVPEDIVEYMKRDWSERMYKMFGGLSPDDWDYDAYLSLKKKQQQKQK